MLKGMADMNEQTDRRVQKLKYEASGLKNCRDNAVMMGDQKV